jgi:hypothetical protein
MKVMLWVTESNLELLNKGEVIQYWLREPGNDLHVVQVQLSYDQYIRLRDHQPDHYSTKNHMRFINYAGTHEDYMQDQFDNYDMDHEELGVED